ncbi:MAG: anaerobic ribonucleoside-triphosphate reductase activating protein [Sarcina sp.]
MNFMRIDNCDFNNGPGVRVTLWVSGCHHNCAGCHNPQTHDYSAGKMFDDSHKEKIMHELRSPYVEGLTISGGDPMSGRNYAEVLKICKEVKKEFPSKTIWIWTGYTVRELSKADKTEIFKYSDVIVDGKYVRELDCSKEKGYRGSSNQVIYNTPDLLDL